MIIKIRSRRDLNEASRKDLLRKSRSQSKDRFNKRLNYQVSNFRGVDLSELFEHDYFVFKTPIKDYVCVIAYPGVLTELRNVVKETHGDIHKVNLQMVIKALRRSFDKTDDIRVDCTCPDFYYRFSYVATVNGYKYGVQQSIPADKTNPNDDLGATCKHLDLLLSNKRWLTKAASVVNALIKTYPDKAALYLYDEDEIVKDDDEEIEDDSEEVDDVEVVNDNQVDDNSEDSLEPQDEVTQDTSEDEETL